MARKKQSYIKGTFTHRRTEADYMGVLLDAVPLEDWRDAVGATVAAAKAGDATARAWLAQHLVGKPAAAGVGAGHLERRRRRPDVDALAHIRAAGGEA